MSQNDPHFLSELCKKMRLDIIDMIEKAASGHPGGSLSSVEILATLWFSEMKGNPEGKFPEVNQKGRDRFVLSKGHGVPTLYSVFHHKKWIDRSEMLTLRQLGSRMQGHPDRARIPLVEASTGSLGQGLSVAQGIAMGLKLDRGEEKVFCLLGDGEIQEGQVWEVAMSAPKFKLNNLVAILDYNGGQIDGPVDEVMPLEPLPEKWKSFGWNVHTVDGHQIQELNSVFEKIRKEDSSGNQKPHFVIAKTVKGKGVSFMEHPTKWHGAAPSADEAEKARKEILGGLQ